MMTIGGGGGGRGDDEFDTAEDRGMWERRVSIAGMKNRFRGRGEIWKRGANDGSRNAM